MKKYLLTLVAILSTLGLIQWAGAASSIHDEIARRLDPVGTVCVEGEDCASAQPQQAAKADSGGGGMAPETIYNQSCSTCHQVGVAGAPKFGSSEDWAPRIEQGMETLYDHAIHGLPPGMPAKGLCMACTEEELKAVTDYMVSAAK